MACPTCGQVIGHDSKLHKEAEEQAKEQGRPAPPKKLWNYRGGAAEERQANFVLACSTVEQLRRR